MRTLIAAIGLVALIATYANAQNANTTVNNGASAASSASSAQGISHGGTSSGNSISNPRQAPAVVAPGLATSPEACMGSSSIGGAGAGFGISFGTTWVNEDCQRRQTARELRLQGDHDVAAALLCANAGVREAYAAVGKTCPGTETKPVALAPKPPASDYCARNPNDFYCKQ